MEGNGSGPEATPDQRATGTNRRKARWKRAGLLALLSGFLAALAVPILYPRVLLPAVGWIGLIPEGTEVAAGRIDLLLPSTLVLTRAQLQWEGGTLDVDTVRARISLGARGLGLESLRLVRPRLVLMPVAQPTPKGMPGVPRLRIEHLEVEDGVVEALPENPFGGEDEGGAGPDPWRFEKVRAKGRNLVLGRAPTGQLESVSFQGWAPSLETPVAVEASLQLAGERLMLGVDLSSSRSDLRFEGAGQWADGPMATLRTLEGSLVAEPLNLVDLRPFLSRVMPNGTVSAEARVRGPLGRAEGRVSFELEERGRGVLQGYLSLPLTGPLRADLTADLDGVPVELLGLPGRGDVSADLKVDLEGSSWADISGTVTGQVASTEPDLNGRLDVGATDGSLKGSANLNWGDRRLGLGGSVTLAQVERPWVFTALVEGPEEDLRVDARGQDRTGDLGVSGTVLRSPLRAQGSVVWADTPKLMLRLSEVPGRVDSARVEFGDGQPGEIDVRAFQADGYLALDGHWAEGRLDVRHFEASRWIVGSQALSRVTGRGRGSLVFPRGGPEGRLTVEMEEVEGGRFDGLHGTATANVTGFQAQVVAGLKRGSEQVRVGGSIGWGDEGVRGTLHELVAHWGEGDGRNRLDWSGSLGLSAGEWVGSGRLEMGPEPTSASAWTAVLNVSGEHGDLMVEGTIGGPTASLSLLALAQGGWREAGPAWVSAEVDSVRVPLNTPLVRISEFRGRARLDVPRWSEGLRAAGLSARGMGTVGDQILDSLRLEAGFRDSGLVDFEGRLLSDGLEAGIRGMARVAEGRIAIDSARFEGRVTRSEALAKATLGALGGRGEVVLAVNRRDGESVWSGSATMSNLATGHWGAERIALDLDGRLDEGPWVGSATARASGVSMGDGKPEDAYLEFLAGSASTHIVGAWGPDLEFRLAGSSDADRMVFRSGELRIGIDTMALAEVAVLTVRRDLAALEGLRFRGIGSSPSRLALAVRVPRGSEWRAEAELDEFPVATVLSWAPYPLPTLQRGILSGHGAFGGDGRPFGSRGEGAFTLIGALQSGDPITIGAEIKLDSEWSELQLVADLRERRARLEAALPRSSSAGQARVVLEAQDFPLDPFVGPYGRSGTVRDARVDGLLALSGSGANGDLQGDLRVTVSAWDLHQADLSFQDVAARFQGGGRSVRVQASAQSGAGSAQLNGTMDFGEGLEPELDLMLETDRFSTVWSPSFVFRTSGTLRLSGSPSYPKVVGDVRVVASEILLGSETTAEPIELTDQDRALLLDRFGWVESGRSLGSWLPLEALAADLSVDLGGDVWVRRWSDPELAVALTGSLVVRKVPGGEFEYLGTLSPSPSASSFRQFGRRFTVTSGQVEMLGPLEALGFSVSGRHEVFSRKDPSSPEAVVTMTVEGSPDSLSVLLESEPSMDQADIISYLILGQPSGNLAFQDRASAAEAGAGIGLSRLSNVLGEAAAETIGLDVVSIEPRGLGGVTLVAGRYVTPRIFVAIRQPVAWNTGEGATGFEQLPVLEAELRAARWLLLNLEGDAQGFGLKLNSRVGY